MKLVSSGQSLIRCCRFGADGSSCLGGTQVDTRTLTAPTSLGLKQGSCTTKSCDNEERIWSIFLSNIILSWSVNVSKTRQVDGVALSMLLVLRIILNTGNIIGNNKPVILINSAFYRPLAEQDVVSDIVHNAVAMCQQNQTNVQLCSSQVDKGKSDNEIF